jgi:hypothetical protein
MLCGITLLLFVSMLSLSLVALYDAEHVLMVVLDDKGDAVSALDDDEGAAVAAKAHTLLLLPCVPNGTIAQQPIRWSLLPMGLE